MNSYEDERFSQWEPWPSGIDRAPDRPGVYMFRLASGKVIGRLKGESDIVYIGTTTRGKGTVRKRLNSHRNAAYEERHAFYRIVLEIGPLQVAWIEAPNHKEALLRESDLLARYAKDHIEFPPVNRSQSFKKLQDTLYYLNQCAPGKEAAVKEWTHKQVLERGTTS